METPATPRMSMESPVRDMPTCNEDHAADAALQLRSWLQSHARVFVLTGAGCSTASGIPDYRDANGDWKRSAPVTYQAFTQDRATRHRYWARSFAGWATFDSALPNASHVALADWEASGSVSMLLTQNVDRLHQRAGSRDVVDLHGRLDVVRCLQCEARFSRRDVQRWLDAANPEWTHRHAPAAPDGDADLEHADFSAFNVPDCADCTGMLKPDVVFYGENVPRERVETAVAALDSSDALLVVGSSLMVYSGFRFARMAHEQGLPIALLTRGVTRADALATLALRADCTTVLPLALR